MEAEILRGIRRELRRLRRIDHHELPLREASRLRSAIAAAHRGELPVDFEVWLGRAITDAERRACSRALERLAAAGKLERIGGYSGKRTTAVRLIEKGKR